MELSNSDLRLLINIFYLASAALFIFGLKRLGSPATARSGNVLAAVGMFVAVIVTLLDRDIVDFRIIILGVIIGSAVGALMARMIKMTAMPQLVAVFNGLGGAASAIVAAASS